MMCGRLILPAMLAACCALSACDQSDEASGRGMNGGKPERAEANAKPAEKARANAHPAAVRDHQPIEKAVLTYDGLGAIRIGMTLKQADAASGEAFAQNISTDGRCAYAYAVPGAPGIGLMIVDGAVARIDVTRWDMKTDQGVGLGIAEEDAIRAYAPDTRIRPRRYADGDSVTAKSLDPAFANYRMVFETQDDKVTAMRAGRVPEVLWEEGCR